MNIYPRPAIRRDVNAPMIKVVSWRMLNRLRNESWAMDNLDMVYLDDERLAWAKPAATMPASTCTMIVTARCCKTVSRRVNLRMFRNINNFF